MESPFLAIPESEWIAANALAFAVPDRRPVTDGHSLVVSRRIFPTWWDATPEEQHAVWALVQELKSLLDSEYRPKGYNVGFDAGQVAGQTVPHFHVHVIPRRCDSGRPPGGLRFVVPSTRLFTGEGGAFKDELLGSISNSEYSKIDIAVAFIRQSGLRLISDALEDSLDWGTHLRILTTDYLDSTEPDALAWLLDRSAAGAFPGTLEVRIFPGSPTGFHPKAYLFASGPEADGPRAAFVGSSNLTRSGLVEHIEWNLLTEDTTEIFAAFGRTWDDARCISLTREWLADYAVRYAERKQPQESVVNEPPPETVGPYPIQEEALGALAKTRKEGFTAGLVVMATGLGKTWLAAFDVVRAGASRVLFVAHREEILSQSRDVFRRVQPGADLGLYIGNTKEPDARIVFASVQTLARRLEDFAPDAFDYIVIDEFHHAAAQSYRRVIDHFEPRFLLGLTATPERMDGADLLALCGENLVFESDLIAGIRRGNLCAFEYFGIRDVANFAPIPWRNGKFDPKALARAVETRDRATQAFEQWQEKGGKRTLAFCCSQTHADFMASFFHEHGIAAVAVHSGTTSAPRRKSIERLKTGDLEVIFSVDIFNEGLDVPSIDTVLMLRPTASPVIFLQQLGRGLRRSPDKERLTAIDLIGNHRSFLLRPRTLLSLGVRSTPSTAQVLNAMKKGEFDLPAGCSVEYDIELVDMFRALVRMDTLSALEDFCLTHFDEEGVRPSAAQTFRAGYNPGSVRKKAGGWFDFLLDIGLLLDAEKSALKGGGEFLRDLEVVDLTKSHKLVTLRALLQEGKLLEGISIRHLAEASHTIVKRDPRLLRDATTKEIPNPAEASEEKWFKYWRRWPIAAWLGELQGRPSRWFRLDDDRFQPKFVVPDDASDAFVGLTAELVEYLLARYLVGKAPTSEGAYACRVSHSSGKPIIRLDRRKFEELPHGEVAFRADGAEYVGDFVKVALNVAREPGRKGNALQSLLRGWFGPSAGLPGTNHRIILEENEGQWTMRPDRPAFGEARDAVVLPLFPTYRIACGSFHEPDPSIHAPTECALANASGDFGPTTHLVVRAHGESMAGSPDRIRHGDYVLLEWVRNTTLNDLIGDTVLVELGDDEGQAPVLKVLDRTDDGGFRLQSTAGDDPIEATADMKVVARLVQKLKQRDLNSVATHLHDQFVRRDIPELHGVEFNVGKWNAGHVSLDGRVVLFVTLRKDKHMSAGSHYEDHLEAPDMLVWSSQSSTTRTGKKGRELLESLESDTKVEVWLRGPKSDPFTYAGWAVLVSAEGEKPIRITWRLLDPLPDNEFRRLSGS